MIILDTHAWIWWVNDDEEGVKGHWHDLVCRADRVAVSSISCFEVAWLAQHGRIKFNSYWVAKQQPMRFYID